MMRVHLLRHGDAANLAPDGSLDDDRRELTDEGIEKLRRACDVFARVIGKPQKIVHSPLVRARQSAEILLSAVANGQETSLSASSELRPGGRAPRVVDMLQSEFLSGCSSIVLVGHEPLLGDLLGVLSSGNDRLSLPMGKGMLATVRMAEAQVMIGRMTGMLSQADAIRLG